ncbi:MAG: protease modulator HflC [Rhodospirillales bacterium]|nr:protease modulator HflC [Alphaproteobacteria bacterium]MCB9986952.1 protease modulator HflC [Rhodospirillales bacterium]USO08273.1 MAG: protease modulator HflC [Rhodospirillales bacterium]
MLSLRTQIAIFILALLLVLGASCLFVVDQTEQAIVLRFGKPVEVYAQAGLKAKLPFPIETVEYFDKRILDVDAAPERVNLASDDVGISADAAKDAKDKNADTPKDNGGIPVIVDTFARYRIVNPVLFLQRLRGEENAQTRIESVMNATTRDVLGKASLRQLLSPDRAELMARIRDRVNADMKDRGVAIVDIRINRADLTEQLRDSTVARMITERREEATEARARGTEKAQQIRATADKDRTVILAQAHQQAETTRGEGDRDAIETITAAANQDPDLYAFIKTMFAYQDTLANPDTTLVLSPDAAFLRYLKSKNATLN